MREDLGALAPPPTKMVSNLPYSVATPLLIRTITELSSISEWVVMVQREIADRLRAEPGTRQYGSPSVARPAGLRGEPAADGGPRRVRAAAAGRVGAAAAQAARARPLPRRSAQLVRDAFAHRRKSLARSLELARPGSLGRGAACARADRACRRTSAAEALAPPEFAELAAELPAGEDGE